MFHNYKLLEALGAPTDSLDPIWVNVCTSALLENSLMLWEQSLTYLKEFKYRQFEIKECLQYKLAKSSTSHNKIKPFLTPQNSHQSCKLCIKNHLLKQFKNCISPTHWYDRSTPRLDKYKQAQLTTTTEETQRNTTSPRQNTPKTVMATPDHNSQSVRRKNMQSYFSNQEKIYSFTHCILWLPQNLIFLKDTTQTCSQYPYNRLNSLAVPKE